MSHDFASPTIQLYKTLLKNFDPSIYDRLHSFGDIESLQALPYNVAVFMESLFCVSPEFSSVEFVEEFQKYPLNWIDSVYQGRSEPPGIRHMVSGRAFRPVSSTADLFSPSTRHSFVSFPVLLVLHQHRGFDTNFFPLSLPGFGTDSEGNSIDYRLVCFASTCEGESKIVSFFARKDSSGNWNLQNESHDPSVRHYKYEDIDSSFYRSASSTTLLYSKSIAFYVQESHLDSFFAFKKEELKLQSDENEAVFDLNGRAYTEADVVDADVALLDFDQAEEPVTIVKDEESKPLQKIVNLIDSSDLASKEKEKDKEKDKEKEKEKDKESKDFGTKEKTDTNPEDSKVSSSNPKVNNSGEKIGWNRNNFWRFIFSICIFIFNEFLNKLS